MIKLDEELTADECTEALKCIAWKGRALIIGFAAGQVEKVTSIVWYWELWT